MKIIKGKSVYSVSEVNTLARQALENMSFWVEGEVSSFKGANEHYRYLYFDLKDTETLYKLPCILEPEIFVNLAFDLEDGKKIIALGNLTLWEKDGRYQMYVHRIEEFGEGILLAQLAQIKRKLERKGYFDSKFKKLLPSYPVNIAVISSWSSDGWQDFKKHSVDKYPIIKVTFFDIMVQGEKSTRQLIASIKKANKMNFDLIAVVRGGGSLEDLSPYNEEIVADAIFESKIPVVVGVGHEKDIVIAQLVADVAASTPTDAAKIVTTNYQNLEERLFELSNKIKKDFVNLLFLQSQTLDVLYHKLSLFRQKYIESVNKLQLVKRQLILSQEIILINNKRRLQNYLISLKNSWKYITSINEQEVFFYGQKLKLLSPQNILARGYSVTWDEKGNILKDVRGIVLGSNVKVKLARGFFASKVFEKNIE